MAKLRVIRYALTYTGVTRDIKVEAFFGQGFASVGDLENINTLSQILLTFKSICSCRLIHPGNISFSITALVSIKALWFGTIDRHRRNKSRTGGEFNYYQRDEFHEIYRDIQEGAEAKHDNEWTLLKWESKTTLPEWDGFLLNVMNNDKFSSNKHNTIQYLLHKQEAPTTTAYLPAGLGRQ